MRQSAYAVAIAFVAIAEMGQAQTFHPDIPRAWDEAEVARFEMPLARRDRSPRYMSAEEYYALKVRPIYRSYPMYAPGREPAGHIESGYRPPRWCLNPIPFFDRRRLAARR